MKLLALETASAWLGVALLEDGLVRAEFHREAPQSQSAALLPAIREVLSVAGLEPKELDAVAINAGPGSFTGLRIGAALARAFADALGIPIVPVPAALALALAGEPGEADGCAVLAGARDNMMVQAFRMSGGTPRAAGELRFTTCGALAPEVRSGGHWIAEPRAAAALAAAAPGARIQQAVPGARWVGELAVRSGTPIPAREFQPYYGAAPVYRKRVPAA